MLIEIKRKTFTDRSTTGDLFLDGVFFCHTLEDKVRIDDPLTSIDESVKIPHKTAISTGTYKLIMNFSPKFGCIMPRLLDVPGFTGILIHRGNSPNDTWGCILVGDELGDDTIRKSTIAFNRLYAKLQAVEPGTISCLIENELKA